MENSIIWKPIEFDPNWNAVKTDRFDNIYPSWGRRRAELQKNPEQYEVFLDQLKRKQAIDTGIIERMYDLKKGVTETFIKEGFANAYLQHGDTNIPQGLLLSYLKDNFDAIDFIFDFVNSNRRLSISYIKELHSLITQHQETTEAIDQFGNHINVQLLKGEFKKEPNNPKRDKTVFCYCPPEQVDSEMDRLVEIFNDELISSHVLVRSAFIHHAFAQIHPFQDGNGRIARLLASFVLIKEGLFPLTIDRDERTSYITALECADTHNYQPLIDIFSNNQIGSIERALNWQTVEKSAGYSTVLSVLDKKLSEFRANEAEQRNNIIMLNMFDIFDYVNEQIEFYKDDIGKSLNTSSDIRADSCSPVEKFTHYFNGQLIDYAKQFNYYVNMSLSKCWARMYIGLDKARKYRLVISLHHYGYDNSTFALGAFLYKEIIKGKDEENAKNSRRGKTRIYYDIPLGIPPLTMSSEKNISELKTSIQQQIEISVMATLAYIANELS